MSTFDGIVDQFPNIRIDHFRHHPGKTPPAACFLSHIHSDHLLGLETLKMPFVYCSAATRRILLKMEKYPHRINFSKGILEARKQTYKHLKLILRPLPLDTPVDLELGPKSNIRVTLFDANHCTGAVMFLIQGNGHAILYSGDVRAEPWWVNSIVRSPIMIPYATGQSRLDCMYLDTTFASHHDIHREFPSKADGLAELMREVLKRPKNSVFYFRAWTLGYEDVWIMLSSILGSQVHVDQYQLRLFRGVADDSLGSALGPALAGFQVGNGEQLGCLTTSSGVQIHSCEPGLPCHTALKKNKNVVWITPIISRLQDGTEIAEVGAGGGGGDLYQTREVELGNDTMIEALRILCANMAADPETASRLETALTKAQYHQDHKLVLDGLGFDTETEISIKDFVNMLSDKDRPTLADRRSASETNVIHFPYSRHSSYSELRHLVEAFKPRDICPCTVDIESWSEELSMESLFGDLCSGHDFRYDHVIQKEVERRRKESGTTATAKAISPQLPELDTQRTETDSQPLHSSQLYGDEEIGKSAKENVQGITGGQIVPEAQVVQVLTDSPQSITDLRTAKERLRDAWRAANNGRDTLSFDGDGEEASQLGQNAILEEIQLGPENSGNSIPGLDGSVESAHSQIDLSHRKRAFDAARVCLDSGDAGSWRGMKIRCLGYEGHAQEELEL